MVRSTATDHSESEFRGHRGVPVSGHAEAFTLLAAALVLGTRGGRAGSPTQRPEGADINPQPRERVRDGGTPRLPLGGHAHQPHPRRCGQASLDVFTIGRAVLTHPFRATAAGARPQLDDAGGIPTNHRPSHTAPSPGRGVSPQSLMRYSACTSSRSSATEVSLEGLSKVIVPCCSRLTRSQISTIWL
jgi:hypothetical protein